MLKRPAFPRQLRSATSFITSPQPSAITRLITNSVTAMASSPPSKRQRTHPAYELLYHPVIPGRGEYVRVAFEAAGVSYNDIASASKDGYDIVLAACDGSRTLDQDGNPPLFAPPALRVPGEGKNGKPLLFHQTPNILIYLGERLGLAGEGEAEKCWINQVMLTALDFNDEAHDTHHPIASCLYYEDQKEESLKRAKDFRETRIPKFLSYFERTLKGNEEEGKGLHLVGAKLSYADTTVWQVINGVQFAFPKEMKARSSQYPLLFEKFYPGIKENYLKEYLESERRKEYSIGVFRHYPELDREE